MRAVVEGLNLFSPFHHVHADEHADVVVHRDHAVEHADQRQSNVAALHRGAEQVELPGETRERRDPR
jgi:hypothetical protein